ncbi:MAG: hypothetical protein ACI8PZ_006753 [Myxococcota bacterium]|jgi:hypothetical protein
MVGTALAAAPWTVDVAVLAHAPGGSVVALTEQSGGTLTLPSCSRLQLAATPSESVHVVALYWEDDVPGALGLLYPSDGSPAALPRDVRSLVPPTQSVCLDHDAGTEELTLVFSAAPLTRADLLSLAGVAPAPAPAPRTARPAARAAPAETLGAALRDPAIAHALAAIRTNFKGLGLGAPVVAPSTVRLTGDARGWAAYTLTLDHVEGDAACDCATVELTR